MIRRKLISFIKRAIPEIDSTKTAYIRTLENIINSRSSHSPLTDDKASISIIIFSKDRAIQLHALLGSYFELVQGSSEIKVLYTASTAEHAAAYDSLKQLYIETSISFTLESDFRKDLTHILAQISTTKLMFLVDDIVFKEPLLLDDFIRYNTTFFVPTLRMGSHLSYSYTTRKQQPLPQFIKAILPEHDKLIWKWQEGQLDWAYPLSVDGHLFDTHEIRLIMNGTTYKAPNSLEESIQQFNPIYKSRYGLALKKSVILNIPNNKVQLENDNHAGSFSTELLLKKWQEGYQIDYQKLYGFLNISAHQEMELEFKKRENRI